ncbi:hypothetical protein PPSIR1_26483 [Plesiocystis pacifica SIR-1]|uniref:Lipoprotein n=1 Tax=Plesiocystis pacifica SIR-1 TaxID=391625 RepID=A6GA07_9BACT|nr:hypothetical protein [Plesiocystis pacifica]EDM77332.1 hypothetical protein PPSIR1_26483 [Plesiocystis pacifica SIR-1]
MLRLSPSTLGLAALAVALSGCGPGKAVDDGDAATSNADEAGDSESESSATASADTDTTESTETDTGDGFIPDDDSTGGPPPCDLFEQDCPPGEKCVPYSSTGGGAIWDATKCVQILGDQAQDEPCNYDGVVLATDDCDATSMCWNVNAEGQGTCHSFCIGSADNPSCPEPSDPQACGGYSCLISGSGVISICVASCDPLDQSACGDGLACYWAGNGFECVFTTQDIATGQPCGFINDCEPGNICVNAEELPSCDSDACCAEFCDLDANGEPCSQEGTTCIDSLPDAADGCSAGICLSPP